MKRAKKKQPRTTKSPAAQKIYQSELEDLNRQIAERRELCGNEEYWQGNVVKLEDQIEETYKEEYKNVQKMKEQLEWAKYEKSCRDGKLQFLRQQTADSLTENNITLAQLEEDWKTEYEGSERCIIQLQQKLDQLQRFKNTKEAKERQMTSRRQELLSRQEKHNERYGVDAMETAKYRKRIEIKELTDQKISELSRKNDDDSQVQNSAEFEIKEKVDSVRQLLKKLEAEMESTEAEISKKKTEFAKQSKLFYQLLSQRKDKVPEIKVETSTRKKESRKQQRRIRLDKSESDIKANGNFKGCKKEEEEDASRVFLALRANLSQVDKLVKGAIAIQVVPEGELENEVGLTAEEKKRSYEKRRQEALQKKMAVVDLIRLQLQPRKKEGLGAKSRHDQKRE